MHFMNLVKYVQVAVILLAAVTFAAASDFPAAPYELCLASCCLGNRLFFDWWTQMLGIRLLPCV